VLIKVLKIQIYLLVENLFVKFAKNTK